MTRRDRYLGFLARSHAKALDALARHFAALPEGCVAGGELDRAAAALAESFAAYMALPPPQRRPHRRACNHTRDPKGARPR